MRLFSIVLLFVSVSAWSGPEPGYLLVLTSQRNAETIAEGARLFSNSSTYAEMLSIQARTDAQLSEMSGAQREELIAGSAGILGIGLYGPSVAHLSGLLRPYSGPLLLIQSDHRLVGLSRFNGNRIFRDAAEVADVTALKSSDDFLAGLEQQIQKHPDKAPWLTARGYWEAVGSENTASLFAWMYGLMGMDTEISPPRPTPRLRWYYDGRNNLDLSSFDTRTPVVAIIDHAGGERPADQQLLRLLCAELDRVDVACLGALASWGEAGVEAIERLRDVPNLAAIVMLQDFVVGGASGRRRVTELYQSLDVPVLKAIKQRDRTQAERFLSSDGLARKKVYYQVAMPELQGASQPLVIATAGRPREDAFTGVRIQGVSADPDGIALLVNRLARWRILVQKEKRHKKLAIIYYNHPPGRHNIGADNLDVPASLWRILNELKMAGYNTGELPESQEALLDLMQARGVNMPRDAAALTAMSPLISRMSIEKYAQWFAKLPRTVQDEMRFGPFGLLHQQITQALAAEEPDLANDVLTHTIEEFRHLLEGVDHPGRARALSLLSQLNTCYEEALRRGSNIPCMSDAPSIMAALRSTGIEGLGGWGELPGKVMVHKGQLLLPGITFGNIFVGPQPPRGWEVNEELLHANLAFPPPHQYLAFYHHLRDVFGADALIHLGRHSTYEFLPRRSVGLTTDDYPQIIAADLPGIYPYIVDGVGEGIQAKRRGIAVMIDHLTPPLAATPLYDELLQLRQMIESFETSHGSGEAVIAERLVEKIREKIDSLELKDELAEAMSAELAVMGIGFDEVDDDMLVHEVGHYLTELQERFMPLGLHVFGGAWDTAAVEMMLSSMLSRSEDDARLEELRGRLKASPVAEMSAFLNALDGGYVAPGQGNDPIRSPDSLPTGRNFYALDNSLIPSRVAWELGQELAESARKNNPQTSDKSEAVILWASDVVRDEGVMIAFGLDMLGLEPVWNSRGLVQGLKHQVLDDPQRVRRDIVFTTSGLFRDLYGQQMLLLGRANLMALDASANIIRREHPALNLALETSLAPLKNEAVGGSEPLSRNHVAAHWVEHTRAMMQQGLSPVEAGALASVRVFGDAPGSYGAGINRLVERSGAWESRAELADVYIKRLGHSYGLHDFGAPAQEAFTRVLGSVEIPTLAVPVTSMACLITMMHLIISAA